MATATISNESVIVLTVQLSTIEANALKGMMQNELHDNESEAEYAVRTAIFTALQEKG